MIHPQFKRQFLLRRPTPQPPLHNLYWPNLNQTALDCPTLPSSINPLSLPFPTPLPTLTSDASQYTLTSDCTTFHAIFAFLSHFSDCFPGLIPLRFTEHSGLVQVAPPLPLSALDPSSDTVYHCRALLPASTWNFPPNSVRRSSAANFSFLMDDLFKFTPYSYYLLAHHLPFTTLPTLIAMYNFLHFKSYAPNVLLPYPFHTVYHYINANFIGPLPFGYFLSPLAIISLISTASAFSSFSPPFALYVRIYLLPLRLLCDYFYFGTHPFEVLFFLFDNPLVVPYCSYPAFLSAVGSTADPARIPPPLLRFHTFISILRFPVLPHPPPAHRLLNIVEYLQARVSPFLDSPC